MLSDGAPRDLREPDNFSTFVFSPPIVRKLTFFGGRGDPLKKRILPHRTPLPFFTVSGHRVSSC